MNPKNIFSALLIAVAGLLYFSFVSPFKAEAVDNIAVEDQKLQSAYQQASQLTTLKTLRLKKQTLTTENLQVMKNFVPQTLHSGAFVYNISQLANQNGLTLKGLQYTVIDDTATNPTGEKKLQVEFNVDGRYESFSSWLQALEKSNVLIDVENIRGTKTSNTGDTISFTVKMYAYGLDID